MKRIAFVLLCLLAGPSTALEFTTAGLDMQALYEFITGNRLSESDRVTLINAVEQDIRHGTPEQVKEIRKTLRESRDIFDTSDPLLTSRMRESLWPAIYFTPPRSLTDRTMQVLLERSGQIVAVDADSKTVITRRALDYLFADNDFVADAAGVLRGLNFDREEAIDDVREGLATLPESERQALAQSESRAVALRIMWQNPQIQEAARKEIRVHVTTTAQTGDEARRLETQAVSYVDGMTEAMRAQAESAAPPVNPALSGPETSTTFPPR